MDVAITKLDMRPRVFPKNLPRGVHLLHEFSTFDHELQTWRKYLELLYQTSMGTAYICLGPDKNLKLGMETAVKLLQDDKQASLASGPSYGVNNSLKNFEDLGASSLHPFVIARSGIYTERSVRKILDSFTGGRIQPTRLHRLMADRPAMTFPYQPYAPTSYKRVKPAYVPPEIKMKYVTAQGTEVNEIFLAGKVINRWSEPFYNKVLADTDYTLWITEGEKKSLSLAMLPLLLGAKMDVIGIPGVWMWGKKQLDGKWKLAKELASYTFEANGKHRKVGIVFDNDSWRNPKVADALLRLSEALRSVGAMVFVCVIPKGKHQKGIDDFMTQYCLVEEGYDFEPVINLLKSSTYVEKPYAVTYPSPDVDCKLKNLIELAEEFEEVAELYGNLTFSEVPADVTRTWVAEIGMSVEGTSTLNGEQFVEDFYALPAEQQAAKWATWVGANVFQAELDRLLDRHIPGVFRGRGQPSTRVTYAQVVAEGLTPEKLKDLNYY